VVRIHSPRPIKPLESLVFEAVEATGASTAFSSLCAKLCAVLPLGYVRKRRALGKIAMAGKVRHPCDTNEHQECERGAAQPQRETPCAAENKVRLMSTAVSVSETTGV